MSRGDFEMFYYSDISLEKVKTHSHPNYELYFFISGTVNYNVEDFSYDLKSGDLLIIPPNVPHHPNITLGDSSYKRIVVWLNYDYVENMTKLFNDVKYALDYAKDNKRYIYHLDYIQFNEMLSIFLDMWVEYNNSDIFKNSITTTYIINTLYKINRLIYQNQSSLATSKKELHTLILEYINRNIAQELSLEKIAKEFYTSKYYVSHIFKDNLGISLHQYVIKKRLSICKNNIATGESITNVAETYGFSDYTSFFRAFKKEYGISPKEYQKSVQISSLSEDENNNCN